MFTLQQPTYANEHDQQQQPQYINSRDARGASLPPQIQAAEWKPQPPPRSKRASRVGSRGSLNALKGFDFNPQELTEKLQDLSAKEKSMPKRPPRRKKQGFRKSATSHTLPRDFGLHSIAEDDNKPMVPMPGLEASPSSGKTGEDHQWPLMKQPLVPMPKADDLEAVTVVRKEQSEEKPSIPQPDGSALLPEHSKNNFFYLMN